MFEVWKGFHRKTILKNNRSQIGPHFVIIDIEFKRFPETSQRGFFLTFGIVCFTKQIPDFRVLIIKTNSFSEKDKTSISISGIKCYYTKAEPRISKIRSKFDCFLIIFPCHGYLTYLFITFCKISHCFETIRFIFEVFMINRNSVSIPFNIAEDIPFIEKCKCILRVNGQGIIISFHCFLVQFKLIIYYTKVVPGTIGKWFLLKIFQIVFNAVIKILNFLIRISKIVKVSFEFRFHLNESLQVRNQMLIIIKVL